MLKQNDNNAIDSEKLLFGQIYIFWDVYFCENFLRVHTNLALNNF